MTTSPALHYRDRRFRSPSSWTYSNIPAMTLLDRGYTGHEYLEDFGLINMNGRMYDPIIGRMLSADPYVQDIAGTQGFNRYSYCLNNPLIYTDPSGYKLKWWQWGLIGLGTDALTGGAIISVTAGSAITTAGITCASAVVTAGMAAGTAQSVDFAAAYVTGLFDPAKGGVRVENHFKLIGGLFQTDANRGFGANLGMLISRWTWESPQTIAGLGYSHLRNAFGKVDRVDYLGGATFATNENAGFRNGVTLGSYININITDEITGSFQDRVLSDPLFMHEFGHTFDSRRFGPAYLFAVGVPSIISAGKYKPIPTPPFDTHGSYWTEIRANRFAKKYFGKYYDVDWNTPYKGRERRIAIDEYGNKYTYWYYFTIEDWYSTH